MENPHAPDNPRDLPLDEALSDTRWVPCLFEEDEWCQHIGCQIMEPHEAGDDTDVNDD